jgi:hypothetical protein
MVLLGTDKLLFSVWPLTKVTLQGDRGKKERKIERKKRETKKPVWRRFFPKEGAKIKSPLIVFILFVASYSMTLLSA